MKLIIREYLASLRERSELDVLLPDLLSQMGLEVFSKPGIGNRQYGVDVAAFGKINSEKEKVFLFSIKSGDLGRKDWDGGSNQDLRPSLNEIRDVYMPRYLPVAYRNKPIEICICFGGDLKEEVRQNVSSYQEIHKNENLSFSEWGGEKLAGYIEEYLLREELLPENCRQYLRKSLAMIDEPEVSLKYFRQLVLLLSDATKKSQKTILTSIRQIYICLWILYAWCREADNLESSFLSGELALLNTWEMVKPYFGKKDKKSRSILQTRDLLQELAMGIFDDFLGSKIISHTHKLYGLSSAVRPSCAVDVNLKLFDILGRLALSGLWAYMFLVRVENMINGAVENTAETISASQYFGGKVRKYQVAIKQLIFNNPLLFTPYQDSQAIDVALAAYFLALDQSNYPELHAWFLGMSNKISFLFQTKGQYPTTIHDYYQLIEHRSDGFGSYLESVTKGSILYPLISAYAAMFNFDDVFSIIQEIKNKYLEHCNFQVWYPDSTSESYFYKNNAIHGAVLSHVCIDKEKKVFLEEVFGECEKTNDCMSLSAIRFGYWPMLLLACRHYRLPVPFHFLKGLYDKFNQPQEEESGFKVD